MKGNYRDRVCQTIQSSVLVLRENWTNELLYKEVVISRWFDRDLHSNNTQDASDIHKMT